MGKLARLSFLMALGLALGVNHANAITVATLGGNPEDRLDFDKETSLLIVGRGKEMGRLFGQAAVTKGYRYRALVPERQIVVIAARETWDSEKETEFYPRMGYRVLHTNIASLTGVSLIREMKRFKKIASVDIYAHTAWIVGASLDSEVSRFDEDTSGVGELRSRFVPGAFAILHGCNSGFKMGPSLAEKWNIPVLGSLAAADFQRLHSSNEWYYNESSRAPDTDWADTIERGFGSPLNCKKGFCIRLKPDGFPYQGAWGSFDAGLGFFKAFCPWGEDAKCHEGLRSALVSNVSSYPITAESDAESVKNAVKESLCPMGKSPAIREKCFRDLEKAAGDGNRAYTPFIGDSLSCSLKGCEYDTPCKPKLDDFRVRPDCQLRRPAASAPSTAFVDEYLLYLRAFGQAQTR